MSNALATTEVPDYLKDYQGPTGSENIQSEDVGTPRLVLLQALSPQLEEDDTLKAGTFYHSGGEAGLGAEVNVIPLLLAKSYTLWRPRPASGILARSRDGFTWDRMGHWNDIVLKGGKKVTWSIKDLNVKASGMADWGSSDPDNPDSAPAATLQHNIPVLIAQRPDLGPCVISLSRSQVKVARKLLGRLKLVKHPLWALSIPMSVVKEQGPEGPFFNIAFGKFGFTPPELADTTRGLFEMFHEKGVTVKDDEQPNDSTGTTDEDVPF